jgi:hypothetical protein
VVSAVIRIAGREVAKRQFIEQLAAERKIEVAKRQFIEQLAAEFKIEGVGELREVVDFATEVYEHAEHDFRVGRGQEADQLDELKERLPKTLELLRELRSPIVWAASRDIYGEGALVRENYGKAALAYTDLLDQLEEIGEVARGLDRRRRSQGQHGDNEPMEQPLEILSDYWRLSLGRKFTQRAGAQAWDKNGPRKKAGEAVRFCYEVIEHIAPGRGACLKSMARYYTDAAIAAAKAQSAHSQTIEGTQTMEAEHARMRDHHYSEISRHQGSHPELATLHTAAARKHEKAHGLLSEGGPKSHRKGMQARAAAWRATHKTLPS